ncbi:MAG: EAL domain-containing protein [Hyphomicrobiales bacterium]|nr:EAL domain-containing protein [Hyphomicrobiales bacterium]
MNIHNNARNAAAAAIPAATPSGRLLIVDDLADNRDVLARRFKRRGFEIEEADGGLAALEILKDRHFDVVLLDVMMPDLDGTEVLREIRKTRSASELPVIMVTAKSQSEDVVDALKLGANDYITKPVDFSIALARVNTQIERRRAEATLRNLNTDLISSKASLETRILERSAELVEANAAIREEVERRIATEDKIAYLAHHDTLTGLANRFYFDQQLNERRDSARNCGEQLALLFLDLDGFKNVNDTLGHAIGDALLCDVAKHLTQCVGASDFCARLGGDEFAIIHSSAEPYSTAAALAQKIINMISGGHVIEGNQVYVGASIGIGVLSGGDSDTRGLMKEADLAMYRAKSDGRGVYRFFETEMSLQLEKRRALEIDLRRALQHNEFQLYYQPVIDLTQKKVISVEALMRWIHPTRGFVPPVEFITLAEETGLIVQLGEWAIRRACLDARQWPDHIGVSVNLSAAQFRDGRLVMLVDEALRSSGLQPGRLELEITEAVFFGNNVKNLSTLGRLRDLGVRVSLDDFGTGYTGLGYFRDFHFDKVKIDQSFVRDMESHAGSRAIVRAAVGLSVNLGIGATAEGVETIEQLEYVISEGCTEVQGHLFSMPQPQPELIKIIDSLESRFFHKQSAA